ncbi:hypothetical protein ERJ75_001313800 [Trypanosoma vivax]|nr:hypothetical protein ERJ75_001313800 [Trypanosoma vivax]
MVLSEPDGDVFPPLDAERVGWPRSSPMREAVSHALLYRGGGQRDDQASARLLAGVFALNARRCQTLARRRLFVAHVGAPCVFRAASVRVLVPMQILAGHAPSADTACTRNALYAVLVRRVRETRAFVFAPHTKKNRPSLPAGAPPNTRAERGNAREPGNEQQRQTGRRAAGTGVLKRPSAVGGAKRATPDA